MKFVEKGSLTKVLQMQRDKKSIQCLNKLFMEFTYVDIVKNVSPKVSIMYIKSSHSAHCAMYDIDGAMAHWLLFESSKIEGYLMEVLMYVIFLQFLQ